MRRTDREITDNETIFQILRDSDYGTLSMCDGETPYAVPMSCGFFLENGEPYLCWHGADAGRKVALLRQNPHIVYSCVSECRRDFAPERLHWSFYYQSVCASGIAEEVRELSEKDRLLHLLLRHFGENGHYDFPRPMLEKLSVWKCHLLECTGKQHSES